MEQKTSFIQEVNGNVNTVSTTRQDLSVTEIVQLFGQFYRSCGYCNDIDVRIKSVCSGDVEFVIKGLTEEEAECI